jgi:transcriptional regulator with XRE-family HTH domain
MLLTFSASENVMRKIKGNQEKGTAEKFGKYLRWLREQKTGFNQSEAARGLDITRQELNYYETGNRKPSYALLMRLAHLYHVATAEVLERAYWPQLILLPLIAIVDPEQLSRDLIDELEKGLKDNERKEITKHIEQLLRKRVAITDH